MPWVGPIGFESELRVQAAAGDSGSRGADRQTTNDWLSPGSPVNLDTSHAELQETVAKLMGTLDVTKLRLHDAEQVAEAEKAKMQQLTLRQQLDKQAYLTEINESEERYRKCSRELREAHRQQAESVGISVLKLSPLRGSAPGIDANNDGKIDVDELKKAISYDDKTSGLQTVEAERLAEAFNKELQEKDRTILMAKREAQALQDRIAGLEEEVEMHTALQVEAEDGKHDEECKEAVLLERIMILTQKADTHQAEVTKPQPHCKAHR